VWFHTAKDEPAWPDKEFLMGGRVHRILFVDDDENILNGLKDGALGYGDHWEMDFAISGKDALSQLSQNTYDAVVTDTDMPEMDGLQLVNEVSRVMPEVLRFVLSARMADNKYLKSIPVIHQVITKSSGLEKFHEVVERTCRVRDLMSDPHLLRVITAIKNLPSVPALYARLVKELQSDDCSPQVVGDIIAQDAAMTARILQLVNSAFFGVADNISSPQRAVTLLGMNTIKALVLGIQIFSEFQGRRGLPITVDALWKHSLLVSSLASMIAYQLNLSSQDREDARVSGVLHDIGILLYFKVLYLSPGTFFNERGLVSTEVENQVLGISHAEMGAYLLGMWGLPLTIVEAVAYHHTPWQQVHKGPGVVDVLHIANGLVNMCVYETEVLYPTYLDMDYLRQAGLASMLDQWLKLTYDLIGRFGSV